MTFLSPTILFGLIAAGIPVMIHLLNLRKLKKVEFSTLAFLKEIQKSKIRRVKLKQWILLTLRVIIIILIVAAFARPTLETTSFTDAAPTAKSSIVIILDNTFSMSAVSGKGSLFNQAKQMIGEILAQSVEGDEFSLVLVSDTDEKTKTYVSNKNEFIKIIDETEISPVSSTIGKALYRAIKISENSDNLNKHIYLLSDFQKSRLRIKDDQLPEIPTPLSEEINLYLFDYSLPEIYNLAITNFETGNQVFEFNKQIGFTAAIENFSNTAIDNTVASLFINGKREAQHSINLPPQTVTQVSFETTLKARGLIKVECILEDDNILYDNVRHLSLFVPEKISILLMADNLADTKYLELALNGSSTENFEITKRRSDQSGSVDLRKYDVVFVVGADLIDDPSNLTRFVAAGGNLVVMPGSKSKLQEFNHFLNSLQLPKSAGVIGNTDSRRSSASFDVIDFTHPLFAGMFEEGKNTEIESPSVYNYFAIKTEGLGQSIINLNTGYSFMSEFRVESGKVLLFNCTPVLSQSDFPLKGLFAPLINKMVYYLTTNTNANKNYVSGESISVNISRKTIPQMEVVRPDLSHEYINIESGNSANYYQYTNADLTGTYQFLSKGQLFDYAVVNSNPLESDTRHLAEKEFTEYLESINFTGNHLYIPLDRDINSLIQQTRYGTELWKPFLVLALLIAVLEMIISKSSKKDLAAIRNDL